MSYKTSDKKFIAMLLAIAICFTSICLGIMPNTADISASAATYSDEMKYGDHLYYKLVDKDYDGIYDYIEISDCDEYVETVEIPSEIDGLPVTSIGESAFSGCTYLKSVTIPNGVTSIGAYAFENCFVLTYVVIPNGVASIGNNSFSSCYDLKNIVIPDSVTSIGEGAFESSGLTSIVIPNGVASIEERVFDGCGSLASIEIPDSVTSIGNQAFYRCINLTDIVIPNGVNSIGNHSFERCESLTSIVIPNSVTSIGDYAFLNCTGITSMEIPDNVTSIGDYAFYNCSALTSITIENPECEIYDSSSTISNGYDNNNYYYNGVIRGYENSTAQAYAEKYGYTFESIDESPAVTTVTSRPAVTDITTTTTTTTTSRPVSTEPQYLTSAVIVTSISYFPRVTHVECTTYVPVSDSLGQYYVTVSNVTSLIAFTCTTYVTYTSYVTVTMPQTTTTRTTTSLPVYSIYTYPPATAISWVTSSRPAYTYPPATAISWVTSSRPAYTYPPATAISWVTSSRPAYTYPPETATTWVTSSRPAYTYPRTSPAATTSRTTTSMPVYSTYTYVTMIMPTTTTTTTTSYQIKGDVNYDGKTDILDIIEINIQIKKSSLGIEYFTHEQWIIADINRDGTVDFYDSFYIAQEILNEIPDDNIDIPYNENISDGEMGIEIGDISSRAGTSVSVPLYIRGTDECVGAELIVDSPFFEIDSLSGCVASDGNGNRATGVFASGDHFSDDIGSVKINIPYDTEPGEYPINIKVYKMVLDGGEIVSDAIGLSGIVTVGKVTLSETELNLAVGETAALEVLNYEDSVKWLSDDTNIATVKNGLVKAVSAGTTTIYAVAENEIFKCKVTVNGNTAVTTSVTTDYVTPETSTTIVTTSITTCTTEISTTTPISTVPVTSASPVTSTSATKATSVTSYATMTEISATSTTGVTKTTLNTTSVKPITSVSTETDKPVTTQSSTTAAPYNISLSETEVDLEVGDSVKLIVEYFDGEVKWFSDDTSIATVKDGRITAVSAGTVEIYAMTDAGNLTCIVNVIGSAVIDGDIDGNGKADLYDAIIVCKCMIGAKDVTEKQKKNADVNGDGKIDLYDAIRVAELMLENSKKS